ncbi:hypothetical protein Pmar_PMAR024363 [Perkinsus marinus ATCC 50983]|uniref:Protein kinase domain-containing protein n=1 Tax=Perkinsus marinus (strain ATCC 50983 / TXsc) TaxID=423536 RepID=C5LMM5_PERM5|nr:hypothetical protein Pmar_PMAR024363 [Perkinsus marinus ATCC 50983]EER02042.1 hypothetical protein Pmar_PMAR024363 [Perkinsus marinus ATCC 50983]|eukprot:XP_002769324.1 hypothetical protein Pmar_PMAR024363 [Perkinsus marinus ATCC 50983]
MDKARGRLVTSSFGIFHNTDLSRLNDGYDNAEGDFICRVNDVIANPEGYGYEIADRLGHGTFGQVLRCVTCDNRSFAVKIIKNKPAYFQQALVEVRILQLLNRYYDTRIVKMTDYFVYRKHLCIVFEQLSMNLYDVLKQNSFRGLPINMIKSIMDQLLRALVCLQTQGIIHCDLKPENILLVTHTLVHGSPGGTDTGRTHDMMYATKGQYGQRQGGMGASSMLQQASGQGRVHMHIAAHHRRLGGNNRDRVSPFSQHSSCSSDSFDDPAFASVPSHELSYMPPAGSECNLLGGQRTGRLGSDTPVGLQGKENGEGRVRRGKYPSTD